MFKQRYAQVRQRDECGFHGRVIGPIRQSPKHVGIHPSKKVSLSKFISFACVVEQHRWLITILQHVVESGNKPKLKMITAMH